VKNRREALETLLLPGRPAYVGRGHLSSLEAVTLICAVGGVAVVAHPGEYRRDGISDIRLREIVAILAEAGLAGIEVWHPSNDQSVDEYVHLATDFDLIATGGSDYHGADKPPGCVGAGYDPVPHETFEALVKLIQKDEAPS